MAKILRDVTDDESLLEWQELWRQTQNTDWGDLKTDDPEMMKALAEFATHFEKMGAKEMVEWGDEPCPHDSVYVHKKAKRECDLCWESLKQEII